MTAARRRVLFLCVANSARSQMAEGLLRHLGGDRFEPHSAGLVETSVRPEAIEVMREIGVDISAQRSKRVDTYAEQRFDVVVTTCDEAREACPVFPGVRRTIHWSIADPSRLSGAARIEAFRAARDDMRRRIERELLAGP